MVDPARPTGALTFARSNYYWVPTLADYRLPTVTEMTAASVLDFTLMAFRDQTDMPSAEFNRVTALERLGDSSSFERRGMTRHTGGNLTFAVDTQAIAGSVAKKAWETWVDGGSGFLVRRHNIPRSTAPASGHFVTVYPADVSDAIITAVGEGEAGETAGRAAYFITGEPAKLVALAP